MSPPQGYTKAELQIEGGDTIQALFNPTELSITKGNNWTFDAVKGTSLPTGKFGGGKPREMQLNLLLDRSLLPSGDQTVQKMAEKLLKMMEVKEGATGGNANAVPPLVTFVWGGVPSFKAACTSLTITFQLFEPNGTPIRAEVKLALTQAETASSASSNSANKKGNPTTRSEGGLGVHVVKDGDSLQSVAHHTYGDPNRWRLIAEANGIDNPMHLRRGTPLNLPRLD
jgi:Contractile injection system tube protein/LysM domain